MSEASASMSVAARRDGSPERAMWSGIVVPPLAWAADELLGLVLSDWICTTGRIWVLHAISGAALVLALGAGTLAWMGRSAAGDSPEIPARRRRFMGTVAVLTALFFAFVIAAGAVPGFIHHPCD